MRPCMRMLVGAFNLYGGDISMFHVKCEILTKQYNKYDILTGHYAMFNISLDIFTGVVFWLTTKRITTISENKKIEQIVMCDITPGNM